MNIHLITALKAKVEIGSKFTGKRELYIDSRTGEYQESLPKIEGYEALLQQAFISKERGIQWAKLVSIVVVGAKLQTTSHISRRVTAPATKSGMLQPPLVTKNAS